MGTTCCCLSSLSSIEFSDWIDLLGIIVNSFLAFWIIRTIQTRLNNKRILKDHFITEMKDIRNDYKSFFTNLYGNQMYPKTPTPWFKLMNIKVNDLLEIMHAKYQIDKTILLPYQLTLQELITNNVDFIKQFKIDKPIKFSEDSRIKFIKFQQENNHLFNDIIVKINDAN